MAAMILVEEVNSEDIFQHWLDLDRQIDSNGGSAGRTHKEGIQGQESAVERAHFVQCHSLKFGRPCDLMTDVPESYM